ncbi:unnamed protein product [Brassica rapa]|uniref:Uncharacterized protein n=2 Tax=Brassica TaxID=3705 RepID=A0A8D9G1I7_BRACM|nr:unnamed protein product [Brassica napus]CAG7865633.1 unnamed protein product [Brassica rapa]
MKVRLALSRREGKERECSMKKQKRRIKLFPQTKKLVRLWEDQCEGWFQQRNETVPVEDVRHRLLLEAVTFGSFLWDVESHVDSRYHFVLNGIYKVLTFCACFFGLLNKLCFCKYWVSPFYRLLQRRSFGQGKRRVNKRTSLAQKEDVIKRTVYVSDIDQHRAFDEGCRGVIAKTVRFSQF